MTCICVVLYTHTLTSSQFKTHDTIHVYIYISYHIIITRCVYSFKQIHTIPKTCLCICDPSENYCRENENDRDCDDDDDDDDHGDGGDCDGDGDGGGDDDRRANR